jgi:hypothetical protein
MAEILISDLIVRLIIICKKENQYKFSEKMYWQYKFRALKKKIEEYSP